MKKKVPIINPELFLYENYEPNWWSALNISYEESIEDDNKVAEHISRSIVGFCDSTRVRLRPKPEYYAIMHETESGQTFWFHLPSEFFNTYFEIKDTE